MGGKLFIIEKLKTSDTFARIQERERLGILGQVACGLMDVLTAILQMRISRLRDIQ